MKRFQLKYPLSRTLYSFLNHLSAWVFMAAVLYTLLSLASYWLGAESLPAFVRIPRMNPGFSDLRQLTHSSGCGAAFSDLLANKANCDPWSRPFNYTRSSLLLFRFIGVDATHTPLAGALLGLLALVVSVWFIFSCVHHRRTACWLAA